MKDSLQRTVKSVLVVVLTLWAGVADAGAATCVDDWSVAGPIVRERDLVSPKRIRKLAGQEFPGELIKMALCKKDDRHFYRLVIFEASGQLRTVIVDAAKPFQ